MRRCSMEIEFYDEAADHNSADLIRWLRDEQVPEVLFDLKHAPLEPGVMGGEFLPVIQAWLPYASATLSAPAVLLVIKSIGTWLQATKRKTKIRIKCPNGAELSIETDGNKNVDDKILELSKLCSESSR
jgi:Effector Associated Constant Component 1